MPKVNYIELVITAVSDIRKAFGNHIPSYKIKTPQKVCVNCVHYFSLRAAGARCEFWHIDEG
jgi:hypothetical protein